MMKYVRLYYVFQADIPSRLCESSCVSLNQQAYSVGMISDMSYTGMVSILCELSCVTSNYPSLRMISDMSYTGMVSCSHVCDELMFQCTGFQCTGFTADITLM